MVTRPLVLTTLPPLTRIPDPVLPALTVVVAVVPAQIVDVQGHQGMVDETLEELLEQIDIKTADTGAGIRHMHLQAGAPGEVDDHAR